MEQISTTVKRKYAASATQIFDAWVTPEKLEQWMFGPAVRDEKILHLELDARKGGRFSFAVERNGTKIDHIGEYLIFERPHTLSFTWGIAGESEGESTVTIDIVSIGGFSELTLTHVMDARWKEYLERTEKGWSFMLDKLNEVDFG
jgi:uncharacterized protein YndB with AHSA1/START domain